VSANPYAIPAFIFLAAVLFGCAALAFLAATKPAGQHARRRDPGDEARQFTEELRGGPQPVTHEPPGERWWDEQPPQPPAVEILTGPGTRIRQTSEVTIGTLARVRDKLLPDAWKPEPAAAMFTPADPDVTLTDLRPADAPQYLAAPQ
jgi:hypothetical protein